MTNLEQLKAARFIAAVFNHIAYFAPLPEKDKELSWAHVLGMAKNHSVFGIVFSVFEERLKKELTEEQFALCQREVSILNAQHIAQIAEFSKVSREFTKAGVYFMPLKGFHIKNLYPSPELRTMKDIDVLVFPESFSAANKVLLENGYEFYRNESIVDVYLKKPFLEIEVHKFPAVTWTDYNFEKSVPSEDNDYLRLMSAEDFIVFVISHAMNHHSVGGCGLRTMFDISLINRHILKKADPEILEGKMKEKGVLEFYQNVCALEGFWFFGESASDELLEFELYTVSSGTYGTKVNYVAKRMKKGKLRFVFLRLFPPYSFMKKAFPSLEKVPFLLPLYYIWRLIKVLFRGSYKSELNAMKEHKKLVKKAKKEAKGNKI